MKYLFVALGIFSIIGGKALGHGEVHIFQYPKVEGDYLAAKVESPRFSGSPDSKEAIDQAARYFCRLKGFGSVESRTSFVLRQGSCRNTLGCKSNLSKDIAVPREKYVNGNLRAEIYYRRSYGAPGIFKEIRCRR